jgi:hypothetical protein
MASVIRMILEGRRIDSEVCNIKDKSGRTPLHSVAAYFGGFDFRSLRRLEPHNEETVGEVSYPGTCGKDREEAKFALSFARARSGRV